MNVSKRILSILKEFASQKELCTYILKDKFSVDIRTLQRDIKVLRDFFPAIVSTKRGCYKLLNDYELKLLFEDNKKIENLMEILSIVDSGSVRILEEENFPFLKDEQKIFKIFENPIEELKKLNFLTELKDAIKYQKYCDIVYFEKYRRDLKDIKPYKIIYAKNNWYLASHTKNYKFNGGFKRFRINFIEDVKVKSKTFKKDPLIEAHIKEFQSLFEDFQAPSYEVILKASPNIERYFRVKKYLKSQKIIKQEEDKSLLLSFYINNPMEIVPLIKTWIPDLKVISPDFLKKQIAEDIKKFLSDI